MLVLDHVLISDGPMDGNICGGVFQPGNPLADKESARVASLTLMTAGGTIEVTDEAALLLWAHYQAESTHIAQSRTIVLSESAFDTLLDYFMTVMEGQMLNYTNYPEKFKSCATIITTLARRRLTKTTQNDKS